MNRLRISIPAGLLLALAACGEMPTGSVAAGSATGPRLNATTNATGTTATVCPDGGVQEGPGTYGGGFITAPTCPTP